jgi:hypothetical protein
VVIHGGAILDASGRVLFNEQQLNVSRTITLEGGSTTFYIEIEFTESDSDVDSRAFWDPTVDQGTDPSGDPRPDGQEFGNSVVTRQTPDWQVVTPVATSNFDYWTTPNSTKVPLIQLTTNTSNQITVAVNPGLATEYPATTLLDEMQSGPPAVFRVSDPQHFPVGAIFNLSQGANQEVGLQVASVDIANGLITCTAGLTYPGTHVAGEILRATGGTAPSTLITEGFGRFLRLGWATNQPDRRDKFFQGDEVHGDALSEGHDTAVDDQSDDVNVRGLKQYVDFLAAQLAEVKFGHRTSFQTFIHASRTPPGLANDFPATPRYYHRSGGVQGARVATITVGDGTNSWGDFVAADETGINAAISNLPAAGGTVVIKNGTYTLANDVVIDRPVLIVGSPNTFIYTAGGAFDVQASADRISLRDLNFIRSSSDTGVEITTASPSYFEMSNCGFQDVSFDVAVDLPESTYINECDFASVSALGARALVRTTAAGADIKGVWSKCTFTATQQTGLAAACIDASGSTLGLVDAKFVDCRFDNSLACVSQVDMGTAPARVVFEKCKINGTATNTSAQLIATNPTELTIKNCRFEVSSSTSLTSAPILVDSISGWSTNIIIENNNIIADSDKVTGILFDISAGSGFQDVQVTNNKFDKCEVSVFCTASAGTGDYWNFLIQGNHMVDRGASTIVASYQKAAILLDIDHYRYRWRICDNVIENVNPANSNSIGALAVRAGIWARNGGAFSTSHMTISGNTILRVGDGSNPTTNTMGIRIDNPGDSDVSNNTITSIDGTDAVGVLMASASYVATTCTIRGNKINSLLSDASNCFGIVFGSGTDCTVSDNVISDYVTASGESSGIRWDSSAAGSCEDVSITGNVIRSDSAGVDHGIRLEALTINRVTIGNNKIRGNSMTQGITLLADATSGTIEDVTVTGNTTSTTVRSFIANAAVSPKANCSHLTVTGNAFRCNSATIAINVYLENFTFVNMFGNTIQSNSADSSTRNIYATEVSYLALNSNIMTRGDATGAVNVYLDTGVTHWLANGNIWDAGGGANGRSLDYGSATHATSGAVSTLNLADQAVDGAGANAIDACDMSTTGDIITGSAGQSPY